VSEVASVVGKLVLLEAALGKAVLVGTRLATIAIVAATDIAEAAMRRGNPWEKRITLSMEAMEALSEILARLGEWNGYPIRCLHTGITLSSVLPGRRPLHWIGRFQLGDCMAEGRSWPVTRLTLQWHRTR
jgi:hypothetical protein